ncbi:MAG: ATP cone domain-containing protein [Patescibacteria group bacterium]
MPEKLVNAFFEKIAKEFQEAGATKWEVLKIIQQLKDTELDKKQTLKIAFEELKKTNPEAAKVFHSFRKMRVFTSKEKLEPFNRGNITKSLVNETRISRQLAEKISSETEEKLKTLGTRYFTTALIRDMVAEKLLEFGQTKTYYQYSRLGLPVFDAEKKIMAKEPLPENEIARQYNWLKAVPQKAKELHFKQKIFIHGVHDYSTKPFGISARLLPSQRQLPHAFLELSEFFFTQTQNATNPPMLWGLNEFFAQPLEKKNKAEAKKTASFCLEQLNQLYAIKYSTFKPIVALNMSPGEEMEMTSKQKEKASEFAKDFAHAFQSRKNNSFELAAAVDSKYKLKLFEKTNRIIFINCFKEKKFPFTPLIHGNTHKFNLAAELFLGKFFGKKKGQPQEDILTALKALQEAFSEKEKRTAIQECDNSIIVKTLEGESFEKSLVVAQEAKKTLKSNTVIVIDDGKQAGIEEGAEFLKNGLQKNFHALDADEMESLFLKNARACTVEKNH